MPYWTSRTYSVIVFILIMMTCLSYSSCSKGSSSSGQPVIYPASWPISSLKAPSGSVAAELKATKKLISGVTYTNNDSVAVDSDPKGPRIWAIGFHYTGDWSTATSEIESCLSGYKVEVFSEQSKQQPGKNLSKEYTVTDKTGTKYDLSVIRFGQDGGYYWHIRIITGNWPSPR